METNNKLKRKSSYKYGRRRSRSLGGTISTEICKTIDKTLEPAERLKLLIEYSLQEALLVAEREVSSDLQPAEFNEKSSELLCKIDGAIRSQDLYTLSITGEKCDETETFSANILQYNEAVLKIDEENKQWDELVSKEREKLNNVPKECTSVPFNGSLDCSMYEKMDYSGIIDDISYAAGNYNFKVDRLKRFNDKLIKCTELTQKITDNLQKEASDKFSTKIADTPRTLIKKLYCRK